MFLSITLLEAAIPSLANELCPRVLNARCIEVYVNACFSFRYG